MVEDPDIVASLTIDYYADGGVKLTFTNERLARYLPAVAQAMMTLEAAKGQRPPAE